MTGDRDAFDRAADREAELRREEEDRRSVLWSLRRSSKETAVALAVTLPIHALVAGRATPWLVAHALLALLGVADVLAYRRDERVGRLPFVRRWRSVTVVVRGIRDPRHW